MPKDTSRILYITTFYPTEDRPHHGIFFRDHAEALAQKHSVALLYVSTPSLKEFVKYWPQSHFYVENKVHTQVEYNIVLSHRNKLRTQKKLIEASLNGFEKLKKTWGMPDHIIAQCSLPAGELAMNFSKIYNIPFSVIEHFSFLGNQIAAESKRMLPIYSNANQIATVSANHKALIESNFQKKAVLINNVVSQEFRFKKRPNSEVFKWLFVGYDDEKKGIDLLTNVLKNRPQLQLTVVGDGLDKLQCDAFQNVIHIQSATRQEMIELMQNHHALVSTSRVETFGMAIVEALASGLPVVATKSGGPDQYLTNEMGILCDVDAQSVLESMIEVENNYHKYDSLQISSSILTKFGAQNYIEQIEKLIQL